MDFGDFSKILEIFYAVFMGVVTKILWGLEVIGVFDVLGVVVIVGD